MYTIIANNKEVANILLLLIYIKFFIWFSKPFLSSSDPNGPNTTINTKFIKIATIADFSSSFIFNVITNKYLFFMN